MGRRTPDIDVPVIKVEGQPEASCHRPGLAYISADEGLLAAFGGNIDVLRGGLHRLKVPLLAEVGVGANWDEAH